MRTLAETATSGTHAALRGVGAADAVLEEVLQEFDGRDAAHPILRETIERTRADLASICEYVQHLLGEFDVSECNAAVLEQLNALVHELQRSS